ncbi:MAG: Hsp20/alpha crystallin family protein [Bacteriovoracia bacterium]
MNTSMPFIWNRGLDPLGEIRREMDRFFDRFWITPNSKTWRTSESEWVPPCDVEEDKGHYLLTLDMPGVQRDQIKLEVVNQQLTISGERRQEKKSKSEDIWYSERRLGRFQRTFALPAGVDVDKVEANYQDGTLRVCIPKTESAKPRQIKISNGSSTGFFGRLIGQHSTKGKEERHSSSDFENEKAAS